MSDALSLNYRGYTISWSDNRDMWVCFDAGRGVENVSLLKVKEAIDRLNLTERKAAATPCFEISDYHGRGTKTESSIVQYLKPEFKHRKWGDDGEPEIEDHKVAVVARRDGSERASRRETGLNSLMPDTPEAHAAFETYQKCRAIAFEADAIAKMAFKAVPRVQLTDIQKLVDLHEQEKEASE